MMINETCWAKICICFDYVKKLVIVLSLISCLIQKLDKIIQPKTSLFSISQPITTTTADRVLKLLHFCLSTVSSNEGRTYSLKSEQVDNHN